MASATALPNITFEDCAARCDSLGADCAGFTFAADAPPPTPGSLLRECFVTAKAQPNRMDMSNSGRCTGSSTPSDCPYHLYRVSGDIAPDWASVLANLRYTLPFLGEGGLHPPYPHGATVRSRPGGWAYPDMLEVPNLANATEDRSHFAAWAIVSAPLILSFDLTDRRRLERAWPLITNRRILHVNQAWRGDPGRRVHYTDDGGWQGWAKRVGTASYAVLLLNGGARAATASLPLRNVSAALFSPSTGGGGGGGGAPAVCLRDLYSGRLLPPLPGGAPLEASLAAHDSALFCAWPSPRRTARQEQEEEAGGGGGRAEGGGGDPACGGSSDRYEGGGGCP